MTLPLEPAQRHVTQAKHNVELLHEVCFPDPCSKSNVKYRDWTVTVSFYIALHYLEAYLHVKGFRTTFMSHRERNDYLKNDASLKDGNIDDILPNYLSLFDLCNLARYRACQYHYMKESDICMYWKFALEDLPKKLNLVN